MIGDAENENYQNQRLPGYEQKSCKYYFSTDDFKR